MLSKRRSRGQRGSLLILSLWIFALLGMLAMSLAFRSRIETKIAGIRQASGPIHYAALSAVNRARRILETDPEPETDSLSDRWQEELSTGDEPGKPEGVGAFSIKIQDEESKIHLNAASAAVFENFFRLAKKEGLPLESEPETWIAGILYWRGGSWIRRRPEGDAYYKKSLFESLDELLLIPGIKTQDVEKLKPYFTVYPQGKAVPLRININTVPPIVLRSLIDSVPADANGREKLYDQILAFREGKIVDPTKPGQNYFLNSDLTVEKFLYRLRLPSSIQMMNLAGQLLVYFTVDSKFFRVRAALRSRAFRRYGVEAIVGPDLTMTGAAIDKNRTAILAWQRL